MKSILITLIFCIFIISSNAQKAGDTLYVAIPKGSIIYAAPDDKSKQLGSIPFGKKIILGEDYKTSVAYKVKELESANVKEADYYITGYWVKINYDGIKGYIFDGYLLSISPFSKKTIDTDKTLKKFVVIEDRYLRKIFKPTGEIKAKTWEDFGAPNWIDEYEQQYQNGATLKYSSGDFGYGLTITIPTFSLREGYLMLKSFIKYNDEERYKIYKKEFGRDAQDYDTWLGYQHESKLEYLEDGGGFIFSDSEIYIVDMEDKVVTIKMSLGSFDY